MIKDLTYYIREYIAAFEYDIYIEIDPKIRQIYPERLKISLTKQAEHTQWLSIKLERAYHGY